MSNIGLNFGPAEDGAAPDDARPPLPRAGSRRSERTRRRPRGCVPLLVVLALLLAGGWFGGGWALDKVRDLASSSDPDYSGTGTGSAVVEVREGDTSAAIGQSLKEAGVVKSVGAFVAAATADERSRSIQVGFYQLRKEMKATEALALLINPANQIQARVTIPEGFRKKDIAKAIVEKTDITQAQVDAALQDTAALGLPAEAGGEVEGYLYPATYTVVPGQSATELLRQMVAKTKQVEEELDIKVKAEALGFTPKEILTIASILEYEGSRDEDYPRIARAIYNRLEDGMLLQSDATVAYANNLTGTVWTTAEERNNPSPYNTYVHTGLPPGPIGSPGAKTIEAALNPAEGEWLYWLVVNLRTGETRFNETYSGHLRDKNVLDEYCRSSDAC